MNNIWTNKKVWILIAVLLLIIGGALYLYLMNPKDSEPAPQLKPLEVTTKELGNTQIPAGFPKNLPSETGSKTIQNYESRTNDNRLQSTKKITSQKPPREALDFYVDFFKGEAYIGGYQETASVKDGQQVAQMQRGEDLLMIVASPSGAGASVVELTLIQKSE